MLLNLFAELKAQGKTLLVCSHKWGEALRRYAACSYSIVA